MVDIEEDQSSLMEEEREGEKEQDKQNESNETPDTTLASHDVTSAVVTAGVEDTTITMEDQPDTSGEVSAVTPVKRKRGRPPLSAKKGPTPKKKVRRPSTGTTPTKEDDNELFLCILEGKSALQSVVSEWVDRYHSDNEASVLELVQYFVRCSGCLAKISLVDFQSQDATTVIRSLTENFDEESFEYPLIMPGPQYKKFKSNYTEFVIRLIDGCGDIIYDDYMLNTLVTWIVVLSDSQVRAFRHTSTLACLKLGTGLIHMITSVQTDIDNTQRQCETERRKSSSRKTSGKLSRLEETLTQLQAQSKELHEMIKNLFMSVFVRRYRDIRPEIRSVCIAELGVWIKEYSSHFLADQFLKYIGWTLSDKLSEVRLQSLQALIPLYSTPDFAPHLELFTSKFKGRFLEMRVDKEDIVASSAINLCTHILSLDMLEAEECVDICQLVFHDNKTVARAAGKFAVNYLFSEDFMIKARQTKKGHKKQTDTEIQLREIVKFFLEFPVHEHAEYLVDSLWEHTDVLKDWETIIELLTVNSSGIVLTNKEEIAVIEILTCSVRKASGCSLVRGGGGGVKGKQLTAREKRIVELEKHEMATELIPILPQLMSKYSTDVQCAINLCNIVQHFELEIFVEIRGQKHLEVLLEQLKDLSFKHTSPEVLHEVSVAYSHLLDPEFTLHSVVDVSFSHLGEELFTNCQEGLEMIEDMPLNNESDKDVFNLIVNLQRIVTLFKQVDMNKWLTDIGKLVHIVELGIDESACDMLVIPSLQCLQLHLMWSLHSLDQSKPDRNQCRSLRSLTNQVMTLCSDLIKLGSSPVQQEAYVILCDLLIVFAKQLASQGDFGSLVYTPDSSLQSSLCEYVMERVFTDSEIEEEPTTAEEAFQLAEKLNNRRTLLAGYLKLVIYSVVDTSTAVTVLGQYVKHSSDCGDLIRYALNRLRETNPINWSRTVLLILQKQYNELKEEGEGSVDKTSLQWADVKDLAHRIALTTGFDLVKCRLPIVGVHHEGVKYSLQREEEEECPDNIDFLEILSAFSFRLLDIDKTGDRGILALLGEQCGNYSLTLDEAQEMGGDWEPLVQYVASLTRGGGVQEGAETDEPVKKRGRGAKRKVTNDVSVNVPPNKSKRVSPSEE